MTSNASLWTAQVAVTASLTAFLYEGFSYNVVFLGRILPAFGKEERVNTLLILFNTVWGLALWSYLRVSWADPGTVPEQWHSFVRRVGMQLPIAPGLKEWQPGKATMCRNCSTPRPERAHHCGLCGVCVLRLDHHCPWINNCVGWNNHKFFLLTCLYAWMACLIAVGTSLPEIITCARSLRRIAHGGQGREGLEPTDELAFIVFGVLAIFVSVFLTPLLFMQLRLAFLNRTTIEDNYDNMDNPFDQGGICVNLQQIFGSFGPDWLFPVKPWNRSLDGISFPTSLERLGSDDSPRLLTRDSGEGEEFLRGRSRNDPRSFSRDQRDSSLYGEELWRCHYNVPVTADVYDDFAKPGTLDYMMGCMRLECDQGNRQVNFS